jgi:hypothetical protein
MAQSRVKGRYIRRDMACDRGFAALADNTSRLLYILIAIQTRPFEPLAPDPREWPRWYEIQDINADECITALAGWFEHGLVEHRANGIVLTAEFLGPAGFESAWIDREERNAIYERDGFACRYCGSTKRLSLDHIIPRAQGGGDNPSNLVTACRSCNSRKHARTPEQAGMPLLPVPRGVN